jgi:hypothetical protein
MLKLTASFSKKVPIPGADYSSQSFHAAVEVELPDGLTQDQLHDRIHQTFGLVKTSVENELQNGHSTPATPVPAANLTPGSTPTGKAAPEAPATGSNGNGNGSQKASPKQVQFLIDLAIRHSINLRDLNALARKAYGADDLNGLTRKQASDFIDRFAEIAQSRGSARE